MQGMLGGETAFVPGETAGKDTEKQLKHLHPDETPVGRVRQLTARSDVLAFEGATSRGIVASAPPLFQEVTIR